MGRTATTFLDYQQRASEFSVGDLAYPIAGGSTDESQAGRVVAVFPGIGQIDLEFPWGSGRFPVEDVQRVTSIVAIPPNPEHTTVPGGTGTVPVPGGPQGKRASLHRVAHAYVKRALYWASKDRHYQATKAELDGGGYTCPKCKDGVLKATVYKRESGRSERLLGCPSCLFLIKRCHIIGDPDYDATDLGNEDGDMMMDDVVASKKAGAEAPSFKISDWRKWGQKWVWSRAPHIALFTIEAGRSDGGETFWVSARLPSGKTHHFSRDLPDLVSATTQARNLYGVLGEGRAPLFPRVSVGEYLEAWVPSISMDEVQ